MILGIGSDITDVRRVAKVIERHGDRFLHRIFTQTERARADRRKNRVETYAKRFAAKEACAKALGTGIRAGVWWRDMGVVNRPSGQPTMTTHGRGAAPAAIPDAARPRGADRSHHFRRRADGDRLRHHLSRAGGAGRAFRRPRRLNVTHMKYCNKSFDLHCVGG